METVDIKDEAVWEQPPVVTEPSFDQKASLEMAKHVLAIFGGVYLLCFIMAFAMMCMKDATFDGTLELVRFLLSSILPLITLAIGYYLGDRNG
ncbi:hypothetical protein [Lacipirellula sp.]|uniref:hypothetical protein n=1 Tax=Lacipirellula sp. TaxID=2691419 RepID=UPI003D0C17BE